MRRFGLAFAALFLFAAPALALDANDRTFTASRVGAIVKATKPGDLAKIYGEANVKVGKVPAAEGLEDPGAFIFQGTPNELQVSFTEGGKGIEFVRIVGKAWVNKDGLRLGTTLAELERLNGGPFQLSGFGWDYGGAAFANGRALKSIGITLAYTTGEGTKELERVMGDKKISSRNPNLKKLGVEVSSIVIGFTDP